MVRCLSFAIRRSLFVARCYLTRVLWLLSAACDSFWRLFVVRCVLVGTRCLVSVVYHFLCVICCLLCDVFCMAYVGCCFGVKCSLCGVCCLVFLRVLCVVCCALMVVGCCLLCVACCVSIVVLCGGWCVLLLVCKLL